MYTPEKAQDENIDIATNSCPFRDFLLRQRSHAMNFDLAIEIALAMLSRLPAHLQRPREVSLRRRRRTGKWMSVAQDMLTTPARPYREPVAVEIQWGIAGLGIKAHYMAFPHFYGLLSWPRGLF